MSRETQCLHGLALIIKYFLFHYLLVAYLENNYNLYKGNWLENVWYKRCIFSSLFFLLWRGETF